MDNCKVKHSVLVVGGGGREHAIVHKLKQSKHISEIYCAPGNAGISQLAECVDIPAIDIQSIVDFVKYKNIYMTVVAPDDPLALGLVDRLQQEGKRAFGPRQSAAEIEYSKAFAKEFMSRHNIPTARYKVFDNNQSAKKYLSDCDYPIVIKASGLALGKGVVIADSCELAYQAIDSIMLDKIHGNAGSTVVIEEYLQGKEVSILAFCDGRTVVPMTAVCDHKRIFDGDKGPNTGGMGAYAPVDFWTQDLQTKAMHTIFKPTIAGLVAENRPFVGVIYFGLIVNGSDIRVIEYNARFGDPETQVALPLIDSDLFEIFQACIDGKLHQYSIRYNDCSAVCVVIASAGYPTSSTKGIDISIDVANRDDLYIYHAATCFGTDTSGYPSRLLTNGGRVLNVVGLGQSVRQASSVAYQGVESIAFEGMQYRKDIAKEIKACRTDKK